MLDFKFNSTPLLAFKQPQETRIWDGSFRPISNVIISYQNTTGSVLALFSTPDIVSVHKTKKPCCNTASLPLICLTKGSF